MKIARLAVLGTALAAGLAAAILASESKQPTIAAAPPPISTDGVLVAAKELNVGDAVEESGLRWVDWPTDHIPEGAIRKSASPAGIEESSPSVFSLRATFCGARASIEIPHSPESWLRANARWRSTSTRKVQARLAGLSCQTTEST
jgi:Flp pilus assembly protein CpaB